MIRQTTDVRRDGAGGAPPEPVPREPERRERFRRFSWVASLIAVFLAGLAWLVWARNEAPEAVDAFLYANGRVEAVSVRVSAEVTGQVAESFLLEGSQVEEGQVLVRLDDTELQIALAEARAAGEALRQSLERIDQELYAWRHHLEIAARELERSQALRQAGVTSDQRYDVAENEYEETRGRVGGLEAERRQTEALLAAAGSRVDLAKLRVGKTTVKAPLTGTVVVRAIEVGELATPGRQVAEVANLEELELRVFVPERELGKVRIGSQARVRVDAFPDRLLHARVARVDQEAQFTPREVHVPEERTRMVFGVTLLVPNPEGFLKPGMPADAWIRFREDVPWPQKLKVPV